MAAAWLVFAKIHLFEIFLYVNNKCVLLALSNTMLLFLTELGNFINYRVEDIKISGYLIDLCSIRMELDMKCAMTGEYFFILDTKIDYILIFLCFSV